MDTMNVAQVSSTAGHPSSDGRRKILYWSPTRKDMYEQCPRRYDHRYNRRVPSIPGVEATCGTLAHDTLELYARGVLDGKYPSLPDKLIFFDILEQIRHKEEYTIVGPNIERVRLWLSLFDGEFTNTVETEWEFRDEDVFGVPSTGRIDRIDDPRKTGGDGPILVVDYKSGTFEKDEGKLLQDDQLGIYAVVLSRRYPGRDISMQHHYLESGRKPLVTFNQADIANAKTRLSRRLQAVDDGVRKGLYQPQTGWWCGFCEPVIRNSCPAYPQWVADRKARGWQTPAS